MPQKLHFISGLPRSGSTLLAAVLAQNPRFHAGMSGPMGSLFSALMTKMSGENEFAIFIDETQKKAILKGVFENYYAAQKDMVVFDTNRIWCSKMPALAQLFPGAKIIACVRQTAWIIDSLESLIRRNPFELSKIFNFDAGGTVFSRAEHLSRGDGLVGFALNALKEAYYGEHSSHLMLLRYETLTSRPAVAFRAVYNFLGEEPFEHDFENIIYDAEAFDRRLGTPGLHRVGRQITTQKRDTILPPEIFRRYENDNFWDHSALNHRGVLIV